MDLPRSAARIAQVAELADALASGASSRKGVEVRVLSWAPYKSKGLGRRGHDPQGFCICVGASCGASWGFGKALHGLT